jgi:hypothetical protein
MNSGIRALSTTYEENMGIETQGNPIDDTQRFYAKLAGFMYLLNYATSVFGAIAPGVIRGTGTLAEQSQRIIASQGLYRTALTSMAIGWVLIVFLAFSLYVVLEPVNRRLAQLALFLELCQASVGAVSVVFSFLVLGIYTGMRPGSIQNDQLQALAQILERPPGSGFTISMMFLAAGSTIFFYLFYRSRYIPRPLAAWGVFSSVLMMIVSVAMLIFPDYTRTLQYGWGPLGLTEVGTALWLMIVGIRQPAVRTLEIAHA